MIDSIECVVTKSTDKEVVAKIGPVNLSIKTPNPESITKNEPVSLFTYIHWNQERGPSIFGFSREIDREIFLLLISCSKIGPSIALQILSQFSSETFIRLVQENNDRELSKANGIGPKKALQIVRELSDKILEISSKSSVEVGSSSSNASQLKEALASLGYSRQEISSALDFVRSSEKDKASSFEEALRVSLGFLSNNKLQI